MSSNTYCHIYLKQLKPVLIAIIFSLLTSCTLLPLSKTTAKQGEDTALPAANPPQTTTPSNSLPNKKILSSKEDSNKKQPSLPIEPTTLLNLLIGELAVHNRNIDLAAEKYVSEAKITRDPGVASRAARLARYQRDPNSALDMAKLWHEVAPEDEKALANYADMLARVDQPVAALSILEKQLQLKQTANFSVLRNSQFKRNPSSLSQSIAQLEKLNTGSHKNFSLIFTHTLLLQKNQQNEAALKQLKKLSAFDSDPIQLAILEASLLSQLKRYQAAGEILETALKDYPDERRLQLPYARILANTDVNAAEQAFATLLETTPNDTKVLISHALTAAENNSYDAAKQSLQQLISLDSQKDFAYFNLGMIEKKQNDNNLALSYFEKVGQGKYFLPATSEVLTILLERKQLHQIRSYLQGLRQQHPLQAPTFWVMEAHKLHESGDLVNAHQVLSQAIVAFPEQQMLRIERANISEKLNNIKLAEQDLRFVLSRDPKNVIVLNALGYTLANKTERFIEALDLIEQAIAQKPDDPAIRDSLGWVQFKLGQFKEAEKNLQKSFQAFPEDEIAAHLIELYWSNNNKRKAKKAYRVIKKQTNQHPLVDEVMQRFDIHF